MFLWVRLEILFSKPFFKVCLLESKTKEVYGMPCPLVCLEMLLWRVFESFQKQIKLFLFDIRPLLLLSYMFYLSESHMLITRLLSERMLINFLSKEIYGFPCPLACPKTVTLKCFSCLSRARRFLTNYSFVSFTTY